MTTTPDETWSPDETIGGTFAIDAPMSERVAAIEADEDTEADEGK